ncbi:unnamed protein product [Gordionus sp. m RMFG-2023]|uniref:transmembrane protein 106B-like n=1 Tax=Gordionus sp. m RMFG-2023 TaxID=3053472 RepID=UPI0030E3D626
MKIQKIYLNLLKNFNRNNGYNKTLLINESGEEYEELMNGSVPCPSCKGLGKIPKEQEAKLIALIPYSDDRLKPRRTSLYVTLSILICTVMSGLLIWFLFPRSTTLRSSIYKIQPYYIHVNITQNVVSLAFKNTFDVLNSNFFPVYIKNASMVAIFDSKRMKTSYNLTSFRVPSRRSKPLDIAMNLTFDQDKGGLVATFCSFNSSWFHALFVEFQTTVVFNYLVRHEEQISLPTYQYINCGPKP